LAFDQFEIAADVLRDIAAEKLKRPPPCMPRTIERHRR